MTWVFVDTYNPIYDLFILRHFRENGININENTTFEEAAAIAHELYERCKTLERSKPPSTHLIRLSDYLTPQELLFWDYVTAWRRHPERRPSLFRFFERALGTSGLLTVKKLAEFESQLPSDHRKVFFTTEEIAQGIRNFYKGYMKIPLKKDLEGGASGRKLASYLTSDQLRKLPDIRVHGLEKVEQEEYRLANEVLQWLETITVEKVAADVVKLLREHSESADHMKLERSALSREEKIYSCDHSSELVSLFVHKADDSGFESQTLTPVRGTDLIEEGWYEVAVPSYHRLELAN